MLPFCGDNCDAEVFIDEFTDVLVFLEPCTHRVEYRVARPWVWGWLKEGFRKVCLHFPKGVFNDEVACFRLLSGGDVQLA